MSLKLCNLGGDGINANQCRVCLDLLFRIFYRTCILKDINLSKKHGI